MKTSDFNYPLSEKLIAKTPSRKRDESRLMVLHRKGGIEHKRFHNFPEYLKKGDLLLLNDTRVFPARLSAAKPTGGKMDIILVKEIAPDTWEILSRKKWSGRVAISEDFYAEITDGRRAHFTYSGNFIENLWKHGNMPLPPYIKRRPNSMDKEWYQTIYAEKEGSIAAPTAGLHFTQELIDKIKAKGVRVRRLTLHVGIGTFKPIRAENVEDHSMDPEYFEICPDIVAEIEKTKASGGRIISVGTTTTRAIEGYMSGRWQKSLDCGMRITHNAPSYPPLKIRGGRGSYECMDIPNSEIRNQNSICGYTDIFIYPGYEFKAVDSLVTNFHLPGSTPLMLTSAFCGLKNLKDAYETAIACKYRFFSYGDAMLIL